MAWSSKHRILVAGGNSVMHIYKVTQQAAAAASDTSANRCMCACAAAKTVGQEAAAATAAAVLLCSQTLPVTVAAVSHVAIVAVTVQVDMSDVLRLKHARHNAQPTARQQLQQQQDNSVSAAAGLGGAGGASSSDAPQVLRRVCPAFKGWKQHQRPGSCAAIGVELLGRKVCRLSTGMCLTL
jgi:hypothetical protein